LTARSLRRAAGGRPLLLWGDCIDADYAARVGLPWLPGRRADRAALLPAIADGDAILMAQKLARVLGLGVGISSGANLVAALLARAAGGTGKLAASIYQAYSQRQSQPMAPVYHVSWRERSKGGARAPHGQADVIRELGGVMDWRSIIGTVAPTLATAIAALLDDPARRERLGRAGRRINAERFAWDRIVDAYLQAYTA
jgi:hypothetical protein